MLKTARTILIFLALACLCLAATPLLAAPAPANPASPSTPAPPAATPAPAPATAKTYHQYLGQLTAAEKAGVEAIQAKRDQAMKDLKAKLRASGQELKALWRAAQFDAAKFAAKSKEVNELAHKLNQLRLEEMAELRARLGAKLPFPKPR